MMNAQLPGIVAPIGHPQDHPNAKLERLGAEALSDKELLAVMLGGGRATGKTIAQAERLATAYPSGLQAMKLGGVVRETGVDARSTAAVTACLELGRRNSGRDLRPVLDAPQRVLHVLPAAIRSARKEHFVAFYLNARSQLIHTETVSVGTLSASLVHPREVFAPAISHAAAALIVCHNHPSGDCTPSAEDKDATRRLVRAGELLGITLLDHLVVADGGFFSFREHGMM